MKSLIKKWIRKKLQNYKVQVSHIDSSKPKKTTSAKKILVVGSGLAGISSASLLAERGFKVQLWDKNTYLGGKTGSWKKQLKDGQEVSIDHGFHAFFYQYYNLQRFLKKIGSDKFLQPIHEYLILTRDHEPLSFNKIEKTPILNIISLGFHGYYSFLKMIHPRSEEMGELLKYHPEKTYEKYDHQSFQDFRERLKLPPRLSLIFNSFSRAFFAEPDQMSMAELIKSFHFFYLSHDHGIDYDYFNTDYTTAFLTPVNAHLQNHQVEVRLGHEVGEINSEEDRFVVNGEIFDYVVLAADVLGTKKIIDRSPGLTEKHPDLKLKVDGLKAAKGYAVYKLWIKGKVNKTWPAFVITDRASVLDSITQFDLFDPESKKWADENEGCVLELHCYSVTDDFQDEDKIKKQFIRELLHYCPELTTADIPYENLQLERNFTSFGMNLHKKRPLTRTTNPGLKLAGDWVKIPVPAMLMEGAYTSGLFAANEILCQEGLREEEIWSVPNKGILAGE